MIDFLKNNISNISPPVYRNSLLFYEWNSQTFSVKQKARKAIVGDYKELLLTTKLVDTTFIETFIVLYERDIDFYDYLFQMSNKETSDFFEIYNMFRCFSCRLLTYEEVYNFMSALLLADSSLDSLDKERISIYLDGIFSEHRKKQILKTKRSIFVVSKKDMDCFLISQKMLEKTLKKLKGIYKYKVNSTDENILIEFNRGRRHLPLLKLIAIESAIKEKCIYLRNIGVFESSQPT